MHDFEEFDKSPTAKTDKEVWDFFKELKTPFKVVYPPDSNGYCYVQTQDGNEISTSYGDGYVKALRINRCLNALKDIQDPEVFVETVNERFKFLDEENKKITNELNNALKDLDNAKDKIQDAYFTLNQFKEIYAHLHAKYECTEHEKAAMYTEYFSIKDANAEIRKKYKNVPRLVVYICDILFG